MPIFNAMAMIIVLICGMIILDEVQLYEWYECTYIFIIAGCSAFGIILLMKKPDDPECLNRLAQFCCQKCKSKKQQLDINPENNSCIPASNDMMLDE